ncbi:MAG: MDR/zinc-dependent alcohol dehydrogenase-like family protein [Cyclobacteriaceae bacterium]
MNQKENSLLEKKETDVQTMRAAQVQRPGFIELSESSIPEPAADEVRFRVIGCGLCASNIPPWEGRDWFDYPMPPASLGHEAWGVIDKVGEEVEQWQVGDHVAAISYHAYADYDLAKAENLVAIPEELKGQPFPGEPLACALNIFERADIHEGMTIAIVGCGFLGCLLTELAKGAGAKVIALSRRETSLELAKKMGADHLIKMDDHYRIIEEIKALTEGKFCERVIEATGKEWPVNLAAELTAERGKLIIAGFHQDGMRQVNMQLWNWRGIDVINAHERDQRRYVSGLQKAMVAVQKGRLHPQPLLTHYFAADQIQQAFEMQQQKPEGFMKAIIKFD